jgi:hypothetical protein
MKITTDADFLKAMHITRDDWPAPPDRTPGWLSAANARQAYEMDVAGKAVAGLRADLDAMTGRAECAEWRARKAETRADLYLGVAGFLGAAAVVLAMAWRLR